MAKKINKPENGSPEVKSAPAKKTVKSKAKPVEQEEKRATPKVDQPKKTEKKTVTIDLKAVESYSRFTDFDIALFKSGKHYKLYEKFGSHVIEFDGVIGTYFAVWAPNAQYVSVIANFNGWNHGSHPLYVRWDGSGIWEGFIPNTGDGETYKYYIKSSTGEDLEKSDPFALRWEVAPHTASIVADTYYEWKDGDWMANRYGHNGLNRTYSVYEMHLGSWARSWESPDEFLTYDQLA
ncbi:MAG TPA: 1,4-alpha-glucan branching protein GlgB, partial [Mucilaginibacter sp.]